MITCKDQFPIQISYEHQEKIDNYWKYHSPHFHLHQSYVLAFDIPQKFGYTNHNEAKIDIPKKKQN